jgi:predicted O-methyltransferase YrrM
MKIKISQTMIKIISKILKKLLPNSCYSLVKKIYDIFGNYKSRNYNLSKDLDYNENLLISLKFEIKKIKSRLNKLNYSYQDPTLSWHYHLFAGLKDYFKNKNIKILEIGTFNGQFTNFISEIYEGAQITTIDLNASNEQFINSYGREKKKIDEFLEFRRKNLIRKNINFIELNSIYIKKYFCKKKFDLVWIDGDHLNPQVTIDIINSLDLLNKNGIICTDDVIVNIKFKKDKYVSNEGFFTLKHLEDNEILKNYYLIKRISKSNAINKKYISISVFKDNSKFIIN